jgi:hypothetical protein
VRNDREVADVLGWGGHAPEIAPRRAVSKAREVAGTRAKLWTFNVRIARPR